MIVVVSKGQLGNQLFFLGAAQKFRRGNETVIAIGFEGIRDFLPKSYAMQLRIFRVDRTSFIARMIMETLPALIRKGLASEVRDAGGRPAIRQGLFPVKLLQGGFFQSNSMVSPDVITEVLAHHRSDFVDQKFPTVSEAFRCFVHVRRKDYLSFPSPEHAASLPLSHYLQQIDRIRTLHPEVQYVVVTDDVEWCEESFSTVPNCQVLNLSPIDSIYAMSRCQAGILSASSFSWWGAKVASLSQGGPFVAPLYWYWWRLGEWRDVRLNDSDFLEFVQVR